MIKVTHLMGTIIWNYSPPRLSSFHASYEYGIKAPLQSKNDMDKMELLRRKIGPPN